MKRTLLLLPALIGFAVVLSAAPTPTPGPNRTSSKSEKKSGGQKTTSQEIVQSARGWSCVKGEWVHPDGYKYVRGQVLRTTARPGKAAPEPPGKLALENPERLTPRPNPAPLSTKTAAEKAAEIRQKNLAPRPAPQTGSNL